VLNDNASSAQTFQVDSNGQGYTLPARSIATFTWSPSGSAPASASAAPLGD